VDLRCEYYSVIQGSSDKNRGIVSEKIIIKGFQGVPGRESEAEFVGLPILRDEREGQGIRRE
jgi:hypothetical protein